MKLKTFLLGLPLLMTSASVWADFKDFDWANQYINTINSNNKIELKAGIYCEYKNGLPGKVFKDWRKAIDDQADTANKGLNNRKFCTGSENSSVVYHVNIPEAGEYTLYMKATSTDYKAHLKFDVYTTTFDNFTFFDDGMGGANLETGVHCEGILFPSTLTPVAQERDVNPYGHNENNFCVKAVNMTLPAGDQYLILVSKDGAFKSDRYTNPYLVKKNFANQLSDSEDASIDVLRTLPTSNYYADKGIYGPVMINYAAFIVDNSHFGPADQNTVLLTKEDKGDKQSSTSENKENKGWSPIVPSKLQYAISVPKAGQYPVAMTGSFTLGRTDYNNCDYAPFASNNTDPIYYQVIKNYTVNVKVLDMDGNVVTENAGSVVFPDIDPTAAENIAVPYNSGNHQGGLTKDFTANGTVDLNAGNYIIELSVTYPVYENYNINYIFHRAFDMLNLRAITFSAPAGGATLASATMECGANDIATFCAPFDVVLPSGVKAFTAAQNGSGDAVDLTQTATDGNLAAGTPVVIFATENINETLEGELTVNDNTCTGGVLVGILTEAGKTVPAGSYVLNDGTQGVGFYKTASDASGKLNRCYVQIPSAAKSLRINFDDDSATGIKNINTVNTELKAVNLSGQRVNANAKGIVIIAGKKFVNK